MSIDFDTDRWELVRTNYTKWWRGQLDRPLIPVTLRDRDPGRIQPDTPILSQAVCTDVRIPAADLIDRLDYELSRCTFLGDAFPFVSMTSFGPGVLAAFLGATIDNSTGRVWFHPAAEQEISEIRFRFDPDNLWFQRIREIYGAGMERWQGQVLMGMTDLGGVLDILSTFRPGEKLMLDLFDHPQEVERLIREAHEAWHQAYKALNAALQPRNPGYSDWSAIYSDGPSYIPQCDFAYMIGPDMFERFAKPELVQTCGKLANAIYHLDGVGQLPHLDSLLQIKELDGIQWVPGDGQPDCRHWPEVYEKIRKAGKGIQLHGGFEVLDVVAEGLGSARGIHLRGASGDDRPAVQRKLATYGIE